MNKCKRVIFRQDLYGSLEGYFIVWLFGDLFLLRGSLFSRSVVLGAG